MTQPPKSEEVLFSFWSQIPAIAQYRDDQEKLQLVTQDVRRRIVEILRTGVEDKHPLTGEMKKRRALSVKEIQDFLNKRFEGDHFKLTNLYFHIEKLVQAGLLQEVANIKDGRRTVTYFGRTAKIFLFLQNEPREPTDLWEALFPIIPKLNPTVTEDEVTRLKKRVFRRNPEVMEEKIIAWFEKNNEVLAGQDIDFAQLYNLLARILLYDHEYQEDINLMAKILDLPRF